MTEAFDRAVREHECPALAFKYLRLNIPEKELGGLLLVSKLANTVQVIPGDLKRVFDKNWKWFGHKAETRPKAYRSFLLSPLNELCRRKPSEVMSRYSISAINTGSTQVARGFFTCLVSLDFGLTTVSSCLRI